MRTTSLSSSLFQKFLTLVLVTVMVMVALPAASPVHAAGAITVTTTDDEININGWCSLREAIIAANTNATYNDCVYPGGGPDDVIVLQSGTTYQLTRPGSSNTTGDLDIGSPTSGNLTIQASGSTNAIIDAKDDNRVVEVDGSGTPVGLTLDHITLENGITADKGAGLYFWGTGTLTVTHSLFYHNDSGAGNNCGAALYSPDAATINISDTTFDTNTCTDPTVPATADGGAIYKAGGGTLNITSSTFVNNSAPDMGGAIRIEMPGGTATIANSTFVNNTAGSRGSAIQVRDGTVAIYNSTFSDNKTTTSTPSAAALQADGGTVTITESILANSMTAGVVGGKDCDQLTPGTITLASMLVENNSDCTGNIKSNSDPNLGPLADNGGFTQTMALLLASPAIDAGGATCNTAPVNGVDQRGVARPQGSKCDLGAYEFIPDVIPPTLLSFTRQVPTTSTTSADVLVFRATFSESVAQVDSADFVVNGTTTATVTNVASNSPSTYDVTVSGGDLATFNGVVGLNLSGTQNIKDLYGNPLAAGEPATDQTYTVSNTLQPLPAEWVGGVTVTSNKNIVSVGRPHIGAEVASYDGFAQGSLTSYVPMLFKKAYGTYNSALYVQNVASSLATITVKYYDSDGNLKCTDNDTVAPLSSKGYWVPTVACDSGSLLDGWVGGAVVTSDQPIVAVGRPHVGSEVMTYDGFTGGSNTSYIPMLFKGAYGGSYNSAFYIQNVDTSNVATITIKYYDSEGVLQCTKADTINPLASKGYWVPSATCDSGSLPAGWVGGVVVTSDQPIVGVGRPHIGTQVTTYNGFTGGGSSSYIPMLFKGAYGGTYNAAFYLQNTNPSVQATVTIKYYSSNGNLDCTKNDTIKPLASKGYWVPSATCDSGSLPAEWVGGVVVTSDQPVVGVGRPHIGAQVTTYNGFAAGSPNSYLPMLFKAAYGGTYNSAFYIQNTENSPATVTVKFYDTLGNLTCTRTDTVQALATVGYWVPTVTCFP
ncbi:MAG: choice-of-anchor Q domain-containing protein [Bacteroidota bacterium]